MTRVESGQLDSNFSSNELQKMIKEQADGLRPKVIKKRPFFSCCNCFLVAFVLIIIGVGWLATAVAKTGIFSVPVLSNMVYKVPEPIRVVEPDTKSQNTQSVNSVAGKSKLVFSEGNLTAILAAGIENINQGQTSIKIDSGQVAVEPDRIETFIRFSKPKEIYLTINFFPQVENNKLKFTVKELKIGSLKIPATISSALLDKQLNDEIAKAFGNLPLNVDSVSLEKGKMIAAFSLDENKFKIDATK